jgi:hypothetical protein
MEILRVLGTTFLRLPFYQQNPFLVHAMLETPASLSFFLYPSGQLRTYSPQAHAVIRQYAVLLVSSILISLIFAFRPLDELSGQVAGALAVYHLAPMVRAGGRLMGRQAVWQPLLFAAAHGVCLAGLVGCCWDFYFEKLVTG